MDTWPGRPLDSALHKTTTCEAFLDYKREGTDPEVRRKGNHAGVICDFVNTAPDRLHPLAG
jgi:hypothetical protein